LPSNWLARPYPMMHFVEEYISTKIRLHEGLLTFNKAVRMNCFDVFIIVLVTVIFYLFIFIMIILSQLSSSLTF